jgi:hypothetical protein
MPRNTFLSVVTATLLGAASVTALAQAGPDPVWAAFDAAMRGTPSDLQRFLVNYPNSPYRVEAFNRLAALVGEHTARRLVQQFGVDAIESTQRDPNGTARAYES